MSSDESSIKDSEVVFFTKMICSSFLGLEVEKSTGPFERSDTHIMASVQITGNWQGSVILDCPTKMAEKVAEIMFSRGPGSATQEEIKDSIAELTNMISGNLKTTFPPPCKLGIPLVDMDKHPMEFPQTFAAAEVPFQFDDNQFLVAIRQKSEQEPLFKPKD